MYMYTYFHCMYTCVFTFLIKCMSLINKAYM